MKRIIRFTTHILPAVLAVFCLTSCGEDDEPSWISQLGGGSSSSSSNDGDSAVTDTDISSWDGELADDAASDVAGANGDIFWEAGTYSDTVKVVYSGSTATVTSTKSTVISYIDNANVTIDLLTNSVTKINIVVSGSTDDGQLKIYGEKRFKLTLSGVTLTSANGPAINCQCKKSMFVHLTDGTVNTLTDASSYSADSRYLDGGTVDSEDSKGCFFSEGPLIFSGTGVLNVTGNYHHAIVSDNFFYMRPGVTIVVNDAVKNAIHVKGDTDDDLGVYIAGGLLYANVSAAAGKAIKSDYNVDITGGKVRLNTTGKGAYDSEERDVSSAAAIKADGNLTISGGTHILNSSGSGGKGTNVDGNIVVSGGETTVTTTGGTYTYTASMTSSPKAMKADGSVTISGGVLNISATGVSDGAEGLECESTLTVSGGELYVYAYDDAINPSSAFNVTGGKIYAYSVINDGIDCNSTFTISDGLVIGVGSSSPESGIDCDNSSQFKINGGTVISLGGTLQSSPSSSSAQRSVACNSVSAVKGNMISVLNSSGSPILTFEFPRTMSGASFFFSTPDITSGSSYTVSTGGTLADYTDSWNGWYEGGTWSGGSQISSFTSSSVVTTVGGSSNIQDNWQR